MDFEWLTGGTAIWGTLLHTFAYLALLGWVWCRRREATETGWRDLRLWIIPLVAVQIALYWLL